MEELLPVGSVVELKNKKKLMIAGYLPSKPNDNTLYDYICTNIFLGLNKEKDKLKNNKEYFYINADEIENVIFVGCQDDEFEEYKLIYKQIKGKIIEARKENRELSNEELEEIYEKGFDELFENPENNIMNIGGNMRDKLLPIGSIVTVGGRDLMICNYIKKGEKINNEEFDYACSLYPTGVSEEALLIKKEQIERVKFIGYQDMRFVELKRMLGEANEK